MNLRDVIKEAERQGFQVDRTKRGHLQFTPPDKAKDMVIASGTPSDKRAILNLIAQLRRSGFIWRGVKNMKEWSVEIRSRRTNKFGPDEADRRLDDLAEYFPVISLGPGSVTYRLTVPAKTPHDAITKAIQAIGGVVVLGMNVMALEDLEREITKPVVPELVGAAEIGEMAGVSRQRADQWTASSDFPPPAVKTKAGRLWVRVSVDRWLERTPRRSGRPKKPAVPA